MWTKTDAGLVLQDTSELLAEVQKIFTDIWPDINLDASTPQGMIITALTDKIAQCQSSIAELANIFYQGGTGHWLDIRNNTLFGLTRKEATTNYIDVQITGLPYYQLKAGLEISDTDGLYKFYLKDALTIGASGVIMASFISDDDLTNAAIAIGDINTLVVPDSNIEQVKNTSYLFKAQPSESDSAYYIRAEQSTFYRSDSTFSAMLAYVKQLDGVTRAEGRENFSNVQEEYKGVMLPSHSVTFVVEGGDVNTIAKGIFKKKNPGCALGGDVEVDVYDAEYNTYSPYKIKFYRPEYVPLYIEAVINADINDNANYKETIYNLINDYLKVSQIGQDIYVLDLINAAATIGFIVRTLNIYDNSDKEGDGYRVVAAFKSIYTIDVNNVNVTVA